MGVDTLRGVTGDEIRRVEFRAKVRGYDPAEVDTLLDRLAAAADRGEWLAPLVDGITFRKRFRGYDPVEVGGFLRHVALSGPSPARDAGAIQSPVPLPGDEIRRVEFPSSVRGYDPDEVDACLDRLAAAADRGERLASYAAQVQFRTKIRGYDPDAVDAFLERVAGADPWLGDSTIR